MKSAMIKKKRLDFEKGAEINENKKVTLEKMRKSNSVENKKYTKKYWSSKNHLILIVKEFTQKLKNH